MSHVVNDLTKESALFFQNKLKQDIFSPLKQRKAILIYDVITATFLWKVLICDWLLQYHSTGCGASFLTSPPVLRRFWNAKSQYYKHVSGYSDHLI
jgi:hypothetical protein